MNEIAIEILIVCLLVFANSILSMSEMAIISARKARLQQRAEHGEKGAQTAMRLTAEPTRFLSTIQVGITLIGVLSGAFGGATIAEQISAGLDNILFLRPYSQAIGVVVVVIVITYISLVIGELVPKRVALNNAEHIAVRVAGLMQRLSRLMSPVVSLLSISTETVLRLLSIKPSSDPAITEDEVKLMIYEGARSGVFEAAEQEIVEHVFRLGNRRISTLMTYRTGMVWLDSEDSLEENLRKIVEARYSRYPLCLGNLDEVLGIVQVKDIFAQCQKGQPIDLSAALHPVLFVPEATSALELLEHFRNKKEHLALVIDEFGGVIGLVTMNDVLEAIVGDIPTLDDNQADPSIVRREDGSYLLDGTLSIEELKDLLKIDQLPGEIEAGYETLGGMLMAELGRIPTSGDYLTWQGYRFEIVDMDGYRVDKVLVKVETKTSATHD
jgi:magnesium and cobalt exporter, CNNM family